MSATPESTTSNDAPVLTELKAGVFYITLNRPEFGNAVNEALVVGFHEAVCRAESDDAVRVLVLRSSGKHFCVGADTKGMAGVSGRAERRYSTEELLTLGGEAVMRLHHLQKPSISALRGAAAGGGLALALATDVRLADPSAKLVLAYTNIALSGDFACAWLLNKWLGPLKAREFCLISPTMSVEQARDVGLVNAIHNESDLEGAVQHLAEGLAAGPVKAIGRLKQNLLASESLTPEAYIQQEANNFIACRDSDEHREALLAFVEKRKPVFR